MSICVTKRCTGCYACYNICRHNAISMISDDKGFSYPIINHEICVGCGLCQTVCPAINIVKRNKEPKGIYSGWSRDEETRLASASGGAFSELTKFFVDQLHGVVFGVAMNMNLEASHISIEDISELSKLQGSKYIQSNIDYSYRLVEQRLKEDRKVLFSGTPCQIAGLKNYLRKDYENLYTVDLVCHGVPSKRLFDDYVKHIERVLNRRVYDVKFRCKKNSWIYYNMALNSHFDKGSRQLHYDYEGFYYSDPFIRGFLRDNALRLSCYQCQYASISRVADFTLADWWGYKAVGKEDADFEKKGVSLILVNSEKAKVIMHKINMLLKERTLNEAMETNMSLKQPFPIPNTYVTFWNDYNKMPFDQMIKKWMSPDLLSPSSYIIYKMKDSFFRRILFRLAKKYENLSKKMNLRIVKINA